MVVLLLIGYLVLVCITVMVNPRLWAWVFVQVLKSIPRYANLLFSELATGLWDEIWRMSGLPETGTSLVPTAHALFNGSSSPDAKFASYNSNSAFASSAPPTQGPLVHTQPEFVQFFSTVAGVFYTSVLVGLSWLVNSMLALQPQGGGGGR